MIENWPSQSAKSWVEGFVDAVDHSPSVWAVIAFGSVVRDVHHCTDVDLLVVYEKERPVLANPPLDVDIRCYNQSDIDRLLVEEHELIGWAILYGVILHETGGYWNALRMKWEARIGLPSTGSAEERAQRAKQLFDDLSTVGDQDAAQEQYVTMLTHLARARLIRAGVYPTSRPELPSQLETIGDRKLASDLVEALRKRREQMQV